MSQTSTHDVYEVEDILTPPIISQFDYRPNCAKVIDHEKKIKLVFTPSSDIHNFSFIGKGHDSSDIKSKILLVLTPQEYSEIQSLAWASFADHKRVKNKIDIKYAESLVQTVLQENTSLTKTLQYEMFFQYPKCQDEYDLTFSGGRCAAISFYITHLINKNVDYSLITKKIKLQNSRNRLALISHLNNQRALLDDNAGFCNYVDGLWSDIEIKAGKVPKLRDVPTDSWCSIHAIVAWLAGNQQLNTNILRDCFVTEPGQDKWFYLLKSSINKSSPNLCSFNWDTLSQAHLFANQIFVDEFHTWSTVPTGPVVLQQSQKTFAMCVTSAHNNLCCSLAKRLLDEFESHLANNLQKKCDRRSLVKKLNGHRSSLDSCEIGIHMEEFYPETQNINLLGDAISNTLSTQESTLLTQATFTGDDVLTPLTQAPNNDSMLDNSICSDTGILQVIQLGSDIPSSQDAFLTQSFTHFIEEDVAIVDADVESAPILSLAHQVLRVTHVNGAVHNEYSPECLELMVLSKPLIQLHPLIIAMLARRAKLSIDIPSRCVDLCTSTVNKLLVTVKDKLESNHNFEASQTFKMFFLIPLICHTNFGTMSLDSDGRKLSNRESLRRKLGLINDNKWEDFTAHSLGLIGAQTRPKKSNGRQKPKQKVDDTGFTALENKVIYLCSKGDFSKAYSILFPNSPAPMNENTLNKLADLHPHEETTTQWEAELWEFMSDSKIVIPENLVRDYIHKSDHLVGPGPSNTTIDSWKAMMGSPRSIEGAKFVTNLTWLQNVMANDKLPEGMAALLQFSSLIALDKGEGKVRPIAMGETLRKMNASLILKVSDVKVKEIFKGAQFGMESMGIEKIIHSINLVRGEHKDWDTISLDHKNAFNLVSRSVISTKLLMHFPEVFNYFRTYYFNAASLLMSDPETLQVYEFFSCVGVQQGDPMGGFLFNVATLAHIRRMIEIIKEGICLAQHDDINAVGPFDRCVEMLKYAIRCGHEYGLHIQPAKTVVMLGVCESLEESLERLKVYQAILEIPDENVGRCIKIHPDNADNDSNLPAVRRAYGVRILGTPIGSPEFIQDWLDVKLAEVKKEANVLLSSISHVQVQWSLIYYCLRNKVNHLFRTISPRYTQSFKIDFDNLLRKVNQSHLGIVLTDIAWTQFKLSFQEGGNGIGDSTSIALAGFIASSFSCFTTVKEICHNPDMLIVDSSLSPWISDIWESVVELNGKISCDRLTISDLHLLSGPGMQKRLSDLLEIKISSEFLSSTSTIHDRARKLSVRCSESGGFLRATPNPKVTWMSNDEWITAIKLRLGLPLHFIKPNCKCICKGNPTVDLYGHHFFTCKHGGERHKTHDEITAQFFVLAKSGGLACSMEPPLDASQCSRRADIVIRNPDIQRVKDFKHFPPNIDLFGDIKVSFPTAQSYVDKGSHSKPGLTADLAYKQKISKYNPRNLDILQGRSFLPISIESYGRFHPLVKPFIGALCVKAAAISGVPASILSNYWINRISIVLQKNISNMMLSRVDRIVHADMSFVANNPKLCAPSYDDLRHPHVRSF